MNPEALVMGYIRKTCPNLEPRVDIKVDLKGKEAKKGYTYRAKAYGNQIKLSLYKLDPTCIKRAVKAANSIRFGVVDGTSLLASELAGKEATT